jgi:glycosyltransferase involved in cell wall biosynthesis
MNVERPGAGKHQESPRVCCIVINSFVNDSRVLKTCRSLVAGGYSVRVVALHDGRADLPEFEEQYGFSVHRIKLSTKKWWRLKSVQFLKYVEYVFRVWRTYRGFDVYHCNDLNALPIGVLCRRSSKGRSRVVYDAHEHESERNGFSAFMRAACRWLEGKLIRHADRVITVSPSIAADYARIYGIDAPEVIYNAPYYTEKTLKNTLREKLGIRKEQRIFLYQGALTKGRGIEILLSAFADLDDNYCLVLIGGGPLVDLIDRYVQQRTNIFHVGMVDPLSLWELTFSADYGIALIENTCRSYYMCMPNKLFEFMMAELPVVVSKMLELERFVTTHNVGIVADLSKESLREAIRTIAGADYATYVRSCRAVKALFTWEKQEEKLLALYRGLDVNRSTV